MMMTMMKTSKKRRRSNKVSKDPLCCNRKTSRRPTQTPRIRRVAVPFCERTGTLAAAMVVAETVASLGGLGVCRLANVIVAIALESRHLVGVPVDAGGALRQHVADAQNPGTRGAVARRFCEATGTLAAQTVVAETAVSLGGLGVRRLAAVIVGIAFDDRHLLGVGADVAGGRLRHVADAQRERYSFARRCAA